MKPRDFMKIQFAIGEKKDAALLFVAKKMPLLEPRIRRMLPDMHFLLIQGTFEKDMKSLTRAVSLAKRHGPSLDKLVDIALADKYGSLSATAMGMFNHDISDEYCRCAHSQVPRLIAALPDGKGVNPNALFMLCEMVGKGYFSPDAIRALGELLASAGPESAAAEEIARALMKHADCQRSIAPALPHMLQALGNAGEKTRHSLLEAIKYSAMSSAFSTQDRKMLVEWLLSEMQNQRFVEGAEANNGPFQESTQAFSDALKHLKFFM